MVFIIFRRSRPLRLSPAGTSFNHTPADLRDDKTALRYAEKAADLTQRKNPQILRASALAYFRNGQKDKAIETVNAALALIPAGQLANLRADLETTLRTFSGADGK